MTSQNNNFIIDSFELFNKIQEALDSLYSPHLTDYFKYLDYEGDYTEYCAGEVHNELGSSNLLKAIDIFIYDNMLDDYLNDSQKFIRKIQKEIMSDKFCDEDYSDSFTEQMTTLILYKMLCKNIYITLEKLKKQYSPSKQQLSFISGAIESLTNETYFYESSRCW